MLPKMIAAFLLFFLASVSSSEIKILDSSGPEPCALICTGHSKAISGQARGQGWWDFHNGWLIIDVDTSRCGFTTVPTVITSLQVQGNADWSTLTVGSSVIRDVTSDSFSVVLTGWVRSDNWSPSGRLSLELAESRKWAISWSATGYNC